MATKLREYSTVGLAPYGTRHISSPSEAVSPKGKGYFGELKSKDGVMTEYSTADDKGEYPLVVPTLTKKELDRLTGGDEPTEEMEEKARSWAESRRKAGKSPFAQPEELRTPTPKKKGGMVRSASSRADGIAKRGKTRGKVV